MKQYGIRRHIAWLTLTPLLVLAASLEIFFLHDRFSAYDHELLERGQLIAHQLAMSSEYGLFSNNREFLQSLAQGALQQEDVQAVAILDAARNPAAEAGRFPDAPPGSGDGTVNSQSPVYQDSDGVRIYHPIVSTQVALDIPEDKAAVTLMGAVIVEMSGARTAMLKTQMLLTTVAATLLFLVFPLGLIIFSSRDTITSIRGLSNAIRQIGEGRLATRVTISAPVAELDALASGINDMAARLQQDNAALLQRTANLAEANRQITAIFDATVDGILVADVESRRFVNGNRSICDMLGYRLEELAGLTVNDIHPPESLAHVLDQFERQTRGEIRVAADMPVKRKDGSAFYADISTAAAILEERNCLVSIFHDVTERKRAEAAILQLNEELEEKVAARTADLEHALDEVRQANRAKSEFLATMSHEIRTPMNGVIGMVDVLGQSGLNEHQGEALQIISDSALSLLSIIDDILDFSRIEAGKLQLNSVPMSVADVVEGVCETMNHMALKKNVELTLFIDPAIPAAVLGDPGRLRQILVNLTNNAIKFSGEQQRRGKVAVRALLAETTPEKATLEFHVTDNGIGMDETTRSRLFTPFSQADSTTTRIYGGTGLGLAISRQLANILGGEITVQSEPDAGSTFSVRLPFKLIQDGQPETGSDATPLHKTEANAAARIGEPQNLPGNAKPKPLPRDEARRRGRLILIAEDNEINQRVIRQQLGLLGETADIAENGREALTKWQSGDYGILLTDLHMPEMDGYELTAAIRAAEHVGAIHESPPHIPIIAITANALKGEAEHCRAVGMNDYLSKPVQLVNLKAVLEKWLPVVAGEAPGVGRALPAVEKTCRAEPVLSLSKRPDLQLQDGGNIPVDVNVLKALIGDDEAMIGEFLHNFRISADKIATELRAAFSYGNTAAAGSLAHKLKSSARSVGALALGELCAEMERTGKAGQTAELDALLPSFDSEISAVCVYLDSLYEVCTLQKVLS